MTLRRRTAPAFATMAATLLLAAPAPVADAQPAASGDTSANVATSPPPSAPPSPPPMSYRGVDLFTAPWYASADLPPDAAPARILAEAPLTSPTAILRSPVPGGGGTLFTFLDLDAAPPPGLGARIVIGDIDGDDEAFLNGRPIGSTKGWGVADDGIPRCYGVAPEILRVGRNVLALRLTGHGGRDTFRIKREPITFAFAAVGVGEARPPDGSTVESAPAKPARAASALLEADARAAIASTDRTLVTPSAAEADAPESPRRALRRKPASFGRFGHFLADGLPAGVADATPVRVEARQGPAFDMALDLALSVELAAAGAEPGLDGFHKLTRVTGTLGGKPTAYTALSHMWFPGMAFTLEKGEAMRFRVGFPGRKGGQTALLDEAWIAKTYGDGTAAARPPFEAFAVYEPRAGAIPALVVSTGAAANIAQAADRLDLSFARPAAAGKAAAAGAASQARVAIVFPTGLRKIDLSSKPKDLTALAALAEPGSDPEAVVRRWLRMALWRPEAVDEYYQVRPAAGANPATAAGAGAGVVRVYQVSRHESPLTPDANRRLGPPLVPFPPQCALARLALDYPVSSGQPVTSAGLTAFSGPWMVAEPVVAPAAAGKPDVGVTWYDLPLAPQEERGLVAVPGEPGLRALLNTHALSDLGGASASTAVDSLYKSRAQAYQAFSYLTADKRRRLADDSARTVPEVLGGRGFHPAVEPLSGLPYSWTYFIEGPFYDRFDQDWGNGLPLVGLRWFARTAGAWDLISARWDGVDRMYSWFAATDDWEWMRAANGLHGHGTGAGDCMNATLGAALAYANLARGAGRAAEADYGAYMAARAATAAVARFAWGDFATAHGLAEADSLPIGYHEGRGFLVAELKGYSWNATSVISGNGVQPENFDTLLKFAPEGLRRYERLFEAAFPEWSDGKFSYGRNTLYKGNSGYITMPHIYLRARTGNDGADTLAAMVGRAGTNTHLWWTAPPALAEAIGARGDGAFVADWGRCAFLGADARRQGPSRVIEAKFDNPARPAAKLATTPAKPESVVFAIPAGPARLTVNDGPVPLTDSRYADGRLTVRLRKPGPNKVVVEY